MKILVLAAEVGGVVGLIAFLSAFSNEFLAWFNRISGFVIVRVTVQGATTARAVMDYLESQGKAIRSPFGDRMYTAVRVFVRPLEKKRAIPFRRRLTGFQTLWFKTRIPFVRIPLWFVEDGGYNFSFFRGTIPFEKYLQEAIDHFEAGREGDNVELEARRFRVFQLVGGYAAQEKQKPEGGLAKNTEPVADDDLDGLEPIGWTMEDFGFDEDEEDSALDRLALTDEMLDVVDEVKFWKKEEVWHRERGVPWNLRYLFEGEPGTGKTALSRALGHDLNLPMFVFQLGTMTDQTFLSSWDTVAGNAPAIALIEDIDRVYEGDRLKEEEAGPNYSTLLNAIDGASRVDGVVVIFTTNHPETLDPALAQVDPLNEDMPTRPGRVDRILKFPRLGPEGKEKIARRIIDDSSLIPGVLERGKNDTGAQFQLRCFRVARAQKLGSRKKAL